MLTTYSRTIISIAPYNSIVLLAGTLTSWTITSNDVDGTARYVADGEQEKIDEHNIDGLHIVLQNETYVTAHYL